MAFYSHYGTINGGINANLVSIEVSGFSGLGDQPATPVTEKQLFALGWLIAHFHDAAGVPWDVFPRHPTYDIVTCIEHWEFSSKACPFSILRGMRDQYQNLAREIMRYYQTGGTSPTPPIGTGLGNGTGSPSTGQPANFQVNDRIKVSIGNPINLRTAPSTTSSSLALVPNNGELCVLSTPTAAQGYRWYQSKVVATNQVYGITTYETAAPWRRSGDSPAGFASAAPDVV
ncbi:MAG: hypothetical protein KF883_15990, partial [Thermomicrobiales bacterium]|nr:hypothetical protein [Thermomicrobiales bacterium]